MIHMFSFIIVLLLLTFSTSSCGHNVQDSMMSLNSSTSVSYDELYFEFEMDVGDGVNSFFIVMQNLEDDYDFGFVTEAPLRITIYKFNDRENIHQTIETHTFGSLFKDLTVGDFNFDGYNDFSFVSFRENANYFRDFWLWDSETQEFVFNASLSELSMPNYDSQLKTVSGYWRNSAAEFIYAHYRYIDGELLCIRLLEQRYQPDGGYLLSFVLDYRDGELVEVFRARFPIDRNSNDDNINDSESYDDFLKWENLLYFGE